MTRGTTPTFVLTLPGNVDLTAASNVYATFRRGEVCVTKTGADLTLTAATVSVYLNQEETLLFPAKSDVEVQLNWTYPDGGRACTEIATVRVERNLLPEVLV